MSDKITLALTSSEVRAKAVRWCQGVSDGSRVTFEPPRRSTDQNAKLWPVLDEIVKARPQHFGYDMDRETYKALFLQALGAEIRFVPSLDGRGMVPIGNSSSKLTKEQFSNLIDLIQAWAAQNGVELRQ